MVKTYIKKRWRVNVEYLKIFNVEESVEKDQRLVVGIRFGRIWGNRDRREECVQDR